MRLTAAMRRKENFIKDEPCVIKKVVTLTDAEYEKFSNNLIADRDFIKRNAIHMGFDNGERHCLLVTSHARQDGILVDSSGYGYARYAAHVPNAKDLLLIRRMTPEMRELLTKVPDIAEHILELGADGNTAPHTAEINMYALEDEYGVMLVDRPMAQNALAQELRSHSEVSDIYFDGRRLEVTFSGQTQEMAQKEPEMEMNP